MVVAMIRAPLALAALFALCSCSAEVSGLTPGAGDAGAAADGQVTDAQTADAQAGPTDAEPQPMRETCTEGPLVVRPTAGGLDPLSLASNGGRWALTYAHVAPDGSEEVTYLRMVDPNGAFGRERAVAPYARVVALGEDGFLVVGPNLDPPYFARVDELGREIERVVNVPLELGRGVVVALSSDGGVVTGVAQDAGGDHVFTVRADSALVIRAELDLPPMMAESVVYGLARDRVLRGSTVRTWDMEAQVRSWVRDANGAWVEHFRIDAWYLDGPNTLHAARWLEARREWWILGTRRTAPDVHAAMIGRIDDTGNSLGAFRPSQSSAPETTISHFSGFEAGALELAGDRAAILFPLGTGAEPVGAFFGAWEGVGTVLSDSELPNTYSRYGNRALLAWNEASERFAALGIEEEAGLVLRCDLRSDGTAGNTAPAMPEPVFDALPELPPLGGECTPNSSAVLVEDPLGLKLLGFARAGDAFGVLLESGLHIVDQTGAERARVEFALGVVELDGAFLVAATSPQRLELIDRTGVLLDSAPFATEIHESRASFGGLAARDDRGLLAIGGELFAIRWDGASLTVPTSTRAQELNLAGIDPERALFLSFNGPARQYRVHDDQTWSLEQVSWMSQLPFYAQAAWHEGQQRWWLSGTVPVPGTPYERAVIESVDPIGGLSVLFDLDGPVTRRRGAKLWIEPALDEEGRVAILIGDRFFATSPLAQKIERGYAPFLAMVAPERDTAAYAYAYEGGTVGNAIPGLEKRRWIEARCGLR